MSIIASNVQQNSMATGSGQITHKGVFPKRSRTFIEFNGFNEFRQSDKSVKHELDSILRSCLSHVSFRHCDGMQVSYARGGRFEPF